MAENGSLTFGSKAGRKSFLIEEGDIPASPGKFAGRSSNLSRCYKVTHKSAAKARSPSSAFSPSLRLLPAPRTMIESIQRATQALLITACSVKAALQSKTKGPRRPATTAIVKGSALFLNQTIVGMRQSPAITRLC